MPVNHCEKHAASKAIEKYDQKLRSQEAVKAKKVIAQYDALLAARDVVKKRKRALQDVNEKYDAMLSGRDTTDKIILQSVNHIGLRLFLTLQKESQENYFNAQVRKAIEQSYHDLLTLSIRVIAWTSVLTDDLLRESLASCQQQLSSVLHQGSYFITVAQIMLMRLQDRMHRELMVHKQLQNHLAYRHNYFVAAVKRTLLSNASQKLIRREQDERNEAVEFAQTTRNTIRNIFLIMMQGFAMPDLENQDRCAIEAEWLGGLIAITASAEQSAREAAVAERARWMASNNKEYGLFKAQYAKEIEKSRIQEKQKELEKKISDTYRCVYDAHRSEFLASIEDLRGTHLAASLSFQVILDLLGNISYQREPIFNAFFLQLYANELKAKQDRLSLADNTTRGIAHEEKKIKIKSLFSVLNKQIIKKENCGISRECLPKLIFDILMAAADPYSSCIVFRINVTLTGKPLHKELNTYCIELSDLIRRFINLTSQKILALPDKKSILSEESFRTDSDFCNLLQQIDLRLLQFSLIKHTFSVTDWSEMCEEFRTHQYNLSSLCDQLERAAPIPK